MSLRHLVRLFSLFLLFLFVGSLILGSVLGQPVLVTYVHTDSMTPTLESGDGFLTVPTQLDDSIETGDVIVYRATTIDGGGLTTHRVVGETQRGYITRGDGNPVTDQSSGEPPVKRAQVVAKAVQFDGKVVVLPGIGTAVEGTTSALAMVQYHLTAVVGMRFLAGVEGLAYLFFTVTIVWYVSGAWRGATSKRRDRATDRVAGADVRLIIGGFAALLVIGATAAMVGPAGTQEHGIVSSEFDSQHPDVISAGESENRTYQVANGGVLPVVSFLEPASEGVDVAPRETTVPAGVVVNATVTLHAPSETGYYRRYVTEHRYLAILPRSAIRSLYQVHPWVPIVVIDGVVAVPFYVLGVHLVGRGRVRKRSRDSSESVFVRVRAWLTGLY